MVRAQDCHCHFHGATVTSLLLPALSGGRWQWLCPVGRETEACWQNVLPNIILIIRSHIVTRAQTWVLQVPCVSSLSYNTLGSSDGKDGSKSSQILFSRTPLCSRSDKMYRWRIVIQDPVCSPRSVAWDFFPPTHPLCGYLFKHIIGAAEIPKDRSFCVIKDAFF